MSETFHDTGYSQPIDDETNRKIRNILDGAEPRDAKHPDTDWQISDETKKLGKGNIAEIRTANSQASVNEAGLSDARLILTAKRKQQNNEALSPTEIRVLEKLHKEQTQE